MSRLVPFVTAFVLVASACSAAPNEGSATPPFTPEASGTLTSGEPATAPPGQSSLPVPAGTTTAFVEHVDDGDSLIVTIGGRDERVRLIGVNAPEQGECVADVARRALADLIEGTNIELEADIEDTDQFGRLLRYVWHEGVLVNEWLAGAGLVLARPFEPNTTRQSTIDLAGDSARAVQLGMWDPNACGTGAAVSFELVEISANPPGRDEENLNGEYVVLVNVGTAPVDLTGYVLKDGSSSNRYQFPDGFVAEPDVAFAVAVGCGNDGDLALFWCHSGPVWDNSGDEIFLTDALGNLVLFDSYQDGR